MSTLSQLSVSPAARVCVGCHIPPVMCPAAILRHAEVTERAGRVEQKGVCFPELGPVFEQGTCV